VISESLFSDLWLLPSALYQKPFALPNPPLPEMRQTRRRSRSARGFPSPELHPFTLYSVIFHFDGQDAKNSTLSLEKFAELLAHRFCAL